MSRWTEAMFRNGAAETGLRDHLALVRENRLRCLIEELDDALDLAELTQRRSRTYPARQHSHDIASALRAAIDYLSELRFSGRLP